MFKQQNIDGMSGCLHYDLECDKVIMSWHYYMQYNDAGARNEYNRKNKAKKRKVSMENTVSMSNI